MNKRRAKRKQNDKKNESSYTNAEEQFINLIAGMIVDITFEQVKNQNKKLDK